MKKSAGLLMFRYSSDNRLQVLLAHPGGPFWRKRDDGSWTIPKGEYVEPETAFDAACREFREETGFEPAPPYISLGDVLQKSGKRISAWAFEGNCDPEAMRCVSFDVEWPPRSGRMQSFPEIDRVGWFEIDSARAKIIGAQAVLLDRLQAQLS
jgi:predicted NUDIX family NTP pyrophosphohydrolase